MLRHEYVEYLHHIPSISSLNASRPMERCPSERPRCHGWCLQYPASAPGGPRRPWMFWMIGLWPVDLQFDGILEQVMSGPPNILQNPCFFSSFFGAVMSCKAIFAYSSTCYLYLFVWRIFQGTSLDQISQRRQAARWRLSPCSMIGAACPLRICLGRP